MKDEDKSKSQLIDELQEMRKRMATLTRPLEDVEGIAFEDMFSLPEIQHLQDLYATAFGVSALITRPDGTPITAPSNFTVLCSQFIRNTEKGCKNCTISDAIIGRHNPDGPIIQPCLSAGLWNAGASITVGGCHVANWVIGQVRNERQKEEEIMVYARELCADETAFRTAYRQVPVMSQEQFERVAQALFVTANQLSLSAYQNIQQARFITEKKQTEVSLRLIKNIFEKAPIGIWRMGPMGEVLDVNDEGCASLGYSREELLGMKVFDFAPGFTMAHWTESTKILNDVGMNTTEAFHQTKDGKIIPIQVIENLMRFENQEFRIAFVQNITERRRNEDALREKDQLLHDIGRLAKIGAWKFDPQTGKATSTEEVARIYDFESIEDVDVENGLNRYRGPHRKKIEQAFSDAVEKGIPYDLELELVSAKGIRKWVRTIGYPEMKDGRVVHVQGSFQDITDRKQNEEELHRLRNFLSNIIDSMPSVLVGVDREGVVTQWNRRAEKETGICSEKARSQPLKKVFPSLRHEMARIMTSIRERRVIGIPKVSRRHGQETRYEDITIYPLVANGVEGAVIRLDDVTERARLEEMMVQSEKMLSVGGLAAGMAHEINNPLAGMIQTANVIKNRLSDLDMPANLRTAEEIGVSIEKIRAFMEKRDVLKMVDIINESGQRAAEIVENMLSFARKSDAIISTHHPVQLMDRILEIAATDYDMKKEYDFKAIKIVKEYEQDLPVIPCEGAQIQQVLLNILRNGSQAMQTAKTESPRFILRIFRKGEPEMVHMEIEDNGPGMDEQIRSKVFDPFFTTKPVGVGTGLGLSVSYFIITKNHKGTMNVSSEPGKGTNFIIRLPVDRKS